MIEINNVEVTGWKAALRGMRNPLNSWDRSDTEYTGITYDYWEPVTDDDDDSWIPVSVDLDIPEIGENDMKLMKNLAKAGSADRKYLRFINVTFDITAPSYWLAEFDTYKVGVSRNSTSLQHKGASRDFTIDDFDIDNNGIGEAVKPVLNAVIDGINKLRRVYEQSKDYDTFRAIRQLMPMSYKYTSTISTNYEALINMYAQRKKHRLSEWRDFCKWVETLPYMEEILIAANLKESD